MRRIVRGGADDSFGIEVAKLAGVPDPVIRRAKKILKEMESEGAAGPKYARAEAPDGDDGQLTMIPAAQTEILEAVEKPGPERSFADRSNEYAVCALAEGAEALKKR